MLKKDIKDFLLKQSQENLYQFANDIIPTKSLKDRAEWISTRSSFNHNELVEIIMKNIDVKHYLSLKDFKFIFEIFQYIEEI